MQMGEKPLPSRLTSRARNDTYPGSNACHSLQRRRGDAWEQLSSVGQPMPHPWRSFPPGCGTGRERWDAEEGGRHPAPAAHPPALQEFCIFYASLEDDNTLCI